MRKKSPPWEKGWGEFPHGPEAGGKFSIRPPPPTWGGVGFGWPPRGGKFFPIGVTQGPFSLRKSLFRREIGPESPKTRRVGKGDRPGGRRSH